MVHKSKDTGLMNNEWMLYESIANEFIAFGSTVNESWLTSPWLTIPRYPKDVYLLYIVTLVTALFSSFSSSENITSVSFAHLHMLLTFPNLWILVSLSIWPMRTFWKRTSGIKPEIQTSIEKNFEHYTRILERKRRPKRI